jgi:hypothetical protein
MDEELIKKAVLGAIERAVDAKALSLAVKDAIGIRPDTIRPIATTAGQPPVVTAGTRKLLTRIVLGDILDDAILSARPQDRTFPLRLFFGELSTLLATDEDDGPKAQAAEQAFTLASALNFFFRAEMDVEAKVRVAVEASRQLYATARAAKMDVELVAKAAPLLAALMTAQLERVKLESVDHVKVFDSQIHERTPGSDATSSRVIQPMTFLCRVAANNSVKIKAQVVT